jgi:hypothetical protein
MRKNFLFKQAITGVLVLSFFPAFAADDVQVNLHKKPSIDNEIQSMATTAKKNSQARVQMTKARKAKAIAQAKAQAARRAQAKKIAQQQHSQRPKTLPQNSLTVRSNPAAAGVATNTAAFDQYEKSNPAPVVAPPAPMVVREKISEAAPAPAEKNIFSGSVNLTFGKDSNATADKTVTAEAPQKDGSFFQIAPTISFKGDIFSGSFGASMKDFSDQQLSDTAKENSMTADLGANLTLGVMKSSTKLDFENNDSKLPDWLTGSNKGMPVRYFQSKITEEVTMDLGQLNLGATGSFAYLDFSTPYLDNPADHELGQNIFEQDRRIAEGSFRVGVKLASDLELAVRPLIRETQYLYEPARQSDGTKGGTAIDAPRRQTMQQEGNLDLVFKTGRVNIVPTVTFGNTNDEALGALDNSYQGGGLKAEFIIDPGTQLKLSGGFVYSQEDYDNWTYNGINNPLPNGEKRKDTERTTTASASVNVTKSVNVSLNYQRIQEVSNWQTPDENYVEEIVGSTLGVSF